MDDTVAVVEGLHADLATWLGSPAPQEVFDRFAAAQHAQFSMVTTAGEVLDRAELLTGLHGARNAQPGLTITISDIEELIRDSGTIVVRFREEHRVADTRTARWVTAVLHVGPDEHIRWRSVQETWIPAGR
ncbi:hypothetical protein [Nocardia sp. NPDC050710]|uniref:hypothetical protein n=1 Tax=Nocardia sp. NPDC050710 TaxID=3157220 RepID=UPI0033EA3BDC